MPRRPNPLSNPAANRSDLLVPRGRPYGERSRNEQVAQQIAQVAATRPNVPPEIQAAIEAARRTPPPPRGGLARPSNRPNEPLQAGLPIGPGSNVLPTIRRTRVDVDAVLWRNNLDLFGLIVSRADPTAPPPTPNTRQLARRVFAPRS